MLGVLILNRLMCLQNRSQPVAVMYLYVIACDVLNTC